MTLMRDEIDFLTAVKNGSQLRIADRAEDKTRQRMRKAGYAEVVMNPRRWAITDAGRQALAAQEERK